MVLLVCGFYLLSPNYIIVFLSRPQSWVSQNMLKEILANLHCGWGGRRLQIIKLSLRYVYWKLGDVLCDKFITANVCFFILLWSHTVFYIILCVPFVSFWD